MIRATLDRRLKRLEASLEVATKGGITLLIISAATGEIIDFDGLNPIVPPTSCHDASLGNRSRY